VCLLSYAFSCGAANSATKILTQAHISALEDAGGRVVVVVVVLEADLSEAEDHQRQARGASYKAEETRANLESRY
jgi:hypothetical protein